MTSAPTSAPVDPLDYSLCEPSHATSSSSWHIRRLVNRKKFFGGGADTPSFCNRITPTKLGGWGGWDLGVDFLTYAVGARKSLRMRAALCNVCWSEWVRLNDVPSPTPKESAP